MIIITFVKLTKYFIILLFINGLFSLNYFAVFGNDTMVIKTVLKSYLKLNTVLSEVFYIPYDILNLFLTEY